MKHFIRYNFVQKKSLHARNSPISYSIKSFYFNINFIYQYRDISERSAKNINSDQIMCTLQFVILITLKALIFDHVFCNTDNKFFINSFCNCLSSNFATLALSSTFLALILLFSTLSLAIYYFNESVTLELSISNYMLI